LGNGALDKKFDAYPQRQFVTESSYNNSLADHHTWSTIKTLPATLPELRTTDRGPRTGVTSALSYFKTPYSKLLPRKHANTNPKISVSGTTLALGY
jgi:hypothetical protein